jgi:hypothetical protein
VEVTTLDELIAVHGALAFRKIDVEGFETDVLAGLTRPLRALSFEYLPPAHDAALAALALVERLGAAAGGYLHNYSPSRRCGSPASAGSTRPTSCDCSSASARWAALATSTPAYGKPSVRADRVGQPDLQIPVARYRFPSGTQIVGPGHSGATLRSRTAKSTAREG